MTVQKEELIEPRDEDAIEYEPTVRVEDLSVHFPAGRTGFWGQNRRFVHAVDGVTFDIRRGETLGLVGESGSGKTTTGRALLRRVDSTGGRIFFAGKDITGLQGAQLRELRRDMQLVFQDPYASLNPRMSVLQTISEPLVVHGIAPRPSACEERVVSLLEAVGLPADAVHRYPHAFSGGQRQRIGIARALALDPKFIVADEPVSALDVSIKAQIVNLLQDLQEQLGLTYLFISHDLSVVRHISDRIATMYAGQIVELADSEEVYVRPLHPYTSALLSAVPIPDPELQSTRKRIIVSGEPPSTIDPKPGCRFASQCPYRQPSRCDDVTPHLRSVDGSAHLVACHWAEEIVTHRIEARS